MHYMTRIRRRKSCSCSHEAPFFSIPKTFLGVGDREGREEQTLVVSNNNQSNYVGVT